jgi:hypothetical protein
MFIQGDLQAVFDALYSVGAIDPVLKLDWSQISRDMKKETPKLERAMVELNACGGDRTEIINRLNNFDQKLVNYIAVEVAREFAEFADRKELH